MSPIAALAVTTCSSNAMKSRIEGGSGTGASSSTVAGSTAADRRTASSPAARSVAPSSPSRSTSRAAPGTGCSAAPCQTPTCWVPSGFWKVLHRTRAPAYESISDRSCSAAVAMAASLPRAIWRGKATCPQSVVRWIPTEVQLLGQGDHIPQ